jgi:hypothetical protein
MKKLYNVAKEVAFRLPLLSLLFVVLSFGARSQCTNQVMHTQGTRTINGVDVAVTHTGVVDSNFAYCPSTLPYFIGYTYTGAQNGNGSYLFSFSPAVNAVTINVSGISNISGSGIEEVKVRKNGVHYVIPAAGVANGCDPEAELTPEGDIAGCAGCTVSGWSQTTIPGPVSTIEIIDTVLYGGPNGSIFSLFICDRATGIDEINSEAQLKVFPNPFINSLNVTSTSGIPLQFTLYDIVSRRVHQETFTGSASINTEQLPKGIYLYEIKDGNSTIRKGKIIKE